MLPTEGLVRQFAFAFMVVAGIAGQFLWPGAPRAAELTLLLMCDMYDLGPKKGRGGYAKVAGVVERERAVRRNVVVAHAGDAFSPTLLSGFDQAAHIVTLLNAIRPDVFVPGNHEYDFGPDIFQKRIAEMTFPVLAANLRDENGKRIGPIADSMMLEVEGAKIGIIGATAQDAPEKSHPVNLVFEDTVETVRNEAKALRSAGADLVVALVHAERDVDRHIMRSGAVDVLLTGDDHDLWIEYNGRTAAVEAKQDGEFVVAVDLSIDVGEEDGKRAVSWLPKFRVIDTGDIAPSETISRLIASYELELSKELDVVVGTIETPLDSRNAAVRGGEAAIGNLYADAIRAATKADVALLNGGAFRANRVYPSGYGITRRDVLQELPFNNKTILLELNGRQLRRALEFGLEKLGEPTGRFPQVSGLHAIVDQSAPAGSRLKHIEIDGQPLDGDKFYTLATNDFLMRGGDGYSMLKEARVLTGDRDGKLIANDVMVHLRALGTVAPKVEGRIAIAD